ncbi:peptidoglycan bridge formation glycyltransferase FemA/FemB family protein [Candidatus Saccharibacteria bacterium]|nr:peptidoglycan bridge formation glycyltransferase FemA/FemB family protein [Candidatus Saccharibacteria bacterium]
MNFTILESDQFRKFAEKHPDRSFYQTPEIAELRAANGWVPYYFGVKEGEKLIAASLVVAKPAFLGKSIYYAPGGPLINYEDAKLVDFFFKNLRNYAKSHNGYLLHIEPYYESIERDRDGAPVEGGFNRKKAKQNLKKFGFKPLTLSDEPKYSFVLELKGYTEDQLFADMKRNTRNHIRKAEKMGVTVRELKREELNIFKKITESTSERRHFHDKPLSYYEKMYDLFHDRGEVKFIVAEVSEDVLLKNAYADETQTEQPKGITTEAKKHSEKECRLKPLSVAMFMTYGDEVIYLFSGSDEKYMKDYNAQYLIQWHMIKYAVANGFKTYNFYGIQGLPNRSSKDYGIYDFKKGFTSPETGRVVELLGAYELPISLPFYQLHRLISRIKIKN